MAHLWFVEHCLAWGSQCQPGSWVDLGEMLAGVFLGVAAIFGFFIGLLALGRG